MEFSALTVSDSWNRFAAVNVGKVSDDSMIPDDLDRFEASADLTVRVPTLTFAMASELLGRSDWKRMLLELFSRDPFIKAMILVASPSLYDRLTSLRSSEGQVAARSLLKLGAYVLRACTKPTPYGLFATIGSSRTSHRTSLARGPVRTAYRLDTGWLHDFERRRSSANTKLATNTAVVSRGGRLYVEQAPARAAMDVPSSYRINSIAATSTIEEILDLQRHSASSISDMLKASPRDERKERIVAALVRGGLLLPSQDGAPTYNLLAHRTDTARKLLPELDAMLSSIESDCSISTFDAGRLKALESIRLSAADATPMRDFPLDVRAIASFDGGIAESVVREGVRLYAVLNSLRTGTRPVDRFERFFEARYEGTSRRVPLLAFAGPSAVDLGLLAGYAAAYVARPRWNPRRTRVLSSAVEEAIRNATTTKLLTDEDIANLRTEDRSDQAHDADFAIELKASSTERIDAGDFLIAPASYIGKGTVGSMASRFADLLSPLDGADRFDNVGGASEVFAEILFPSNVPRHVNVLTRAVTSPYTLEVGTAGRSEKALDLRLLLVQIEDGRFRLWSEEIQQYVVPVLTTAYRADLYGSALVRFLAALAADRRPDPEAFSWGPLESMPFRPRLQYGRAVLRRADWILDFGSRSNVRERLAVLDQARRSRGLPSRVRLVGDDGGDDVIAIDVDSEFGRELLIDASRTKSYIRLEEDFFDATWLRSESGTHRHELVIPIRSRAIPPLAAEPTSRRIVEIAEQRAFAPGSEWIYVQIFCSVDDADRVVLMAASIAERVRAREAGTLWHFVRYRVTGYHIRVRFRTHDDRCAFHMVLDELSTLVREEKISAFSLVTYERELERYAALGSADVVERLFASSSDAAVCCLRQAAHDVTRLELAVSSCIDLLELVPGAMHLEAVLGRAPTRRRPATTSERDAIRAVSRRRNLATDDTGLRTAGDPARSPSPETVDALWSLCHMHFNRCGLSGASESSATHVLRHVLVSMLARANLCRTKSQSKSHKTLTVDDKRSVARSEEVALDV